jgi:hypothetical protein
MKNYLIPILAAVVILFFVFPSLALAVHGIENGDMESVHQVQPPTGTQYCADFSVLNVNPIGCGRSQKSAWKPQIWNSTFAGNDFGVSWTASKHGGTWATALWWQPPSQCMYNETAGACGPMPIGQEGYLIQHNVSVASSPVTATFWAKKCDFRPVQCEGWFCNGDQYYGNNGTNMGRFVFRTYDYSTGNYTSYPFEATDGWKKYSVTLNMNTSSYYDIQWQTMSLTGIEQNPNCILFDDFTFEYGTGETSPALEYINDMVNKTNFPYGFGGVGTVNTLEISKHFQNVPLVNFAWQSSGYSGCLLGTYYTGTCSPTIKIGYTNGNVVDVTSLSTVSHSCFGSNQCQNGGILPLLNYTNVRNVTVTGTHVGTYYFNLTSNLTVRSTYGNLLDGYEDIHANPNLFPVIIYDTYLTSDGNLTFKAWNFKSSESVTSNLVFDLLGSGSSIIDTTSGTYSFPTGMSSWGQTSFAGDYAGAEAVNITFKSSSASLLGTGTWTYFPLTGAAFACESGCDVEVPTTYVVAEWSGDTCIRDYFPNDTRCLPTPEPEAPPTIFESDVTQPIAVFNQTDVIASGYGWTLALVTPIFLVTIILLVIAALISWKTGSAELGLASFIALIVILTSLGFYPVWIGIFIFIITVAILAWFIRKIIMPGGGGGG